MEAVIKTYSGVLLNVKSPDKSKIRIDDIAHALSNINLYNGHFPFPLSAGYRAIKVFEKVSKKKNYTPSMGLHALLSNSSEAYLCNVPKPIKNDFKAYWGYEQEMMDVIFAKYGIEEHKFAVEVAEATQEVEDWENNIWVHYNENPIKLPMTTEHVKSKFLKLFYELVNARQNEK